jgi:hypothetical protein
MKNAVFWDMTPCRSCKNQYFGGTYQLLVSAIVPSSLILSTLMIEAIYFSEISVLTTATRRHIPEGSILYNQYYIYLGW